jgi:hypothetical protein
MKFFPKRANTVMAATFIAGALSGVAGAAIAATTLGSYVFPDVASGSFYDSAVGEMYNLGIIKGYDNGKFGPDDAVTRGQLAVMLQRFRDNLVNSGVSVSSSSRNNSSMSSSSSSSVATSTSGVLRFTSATYNAPESATAQILVVRTGGAKGTVTVDYATSNGTAIAGTDYTATNGTLTFANNETSKSFTISLINNPLPQGNKTITLSLRNVTNGAVLGTPSTTTVTITDNQSTNSSASSMSSTSSSASSNPAGTISLGAAAYMVNETASPLTITVNRVGGTTGTVSVTYGTSNGTATSGSDYSSVSGTLTFNNGESTKSFTIPVNNNTSITGNKTFNIVIGTPTGGASLSSVTTAPITIIDNDSPSSGSGSVKVNKASYDISKSAGFVDIGIQRTISAAGTITVSYQTTPLTASDGVDYNGVSGTLTFLPGESIKNIRVPITKTVSSANAGKTFSLDILGVSSNAVLGSPTSATVTIDN